MSTNPKKPNRKFDPEFIENAVKLVTVEGYSKIAAAKAVNVPISTLRQWCKKHAAKSGEAGNKPTFEELEEWHARWQVPTIFWGLYGNV